MLTLKGEPNVARWRYVVNLLCRYPERVLRSFPHGGNGAGLLVLRNALVVMLISLAGESLARPIPRLTLIPPILAIACVSLGFLTRSIVGICGLATLIAIFVDPNANLERGGVVIAVAVSISLLGPGAYSIDSFRYGWRRRILPHVD